MGIIFTASWCMTIVSQFVSRYFVSSRNFPERIDKFTDQVQKLVHTTDWDRTTPASDKIGQGISLTVMCKYSHHTKVWCGIEDTFRDVFQFI